MRVRVVPCAHSPASCDRIVAAVLGEGTVVGNDCVVGTGVNLPPNDVLPDSVVVHAPRNSRRTLSDTKEVGEKPSTHHHHLGSNSPS